MVNRNVVWKWVKALNGLKEESLAAQRLAVVLMIHVAQRPDGDAFAAEMKKWLTDDLVKERYRGSLDVSDQLLVKLAVVLEGRHFRLDVNPFVKTLKVGLIEQCYAL